MCEAPGPPTAAFLSHRSGGAEPPRQARLTLYGLPPGSTKHSPAEVRDQGWKSSLPPLAGGGTSLPADPTLNSVADQLPASAGVRVSGGPASRPGARPASRPAAAPG